MECSKAGLGSQGECPTGCRGEAPLCATILTPNPSPDAGDGSSNPPTPSAGPAPEPAIIDRGGGRSDILRRPTVFVLSTLLLLALASTACGDGGASQTKPTPTPRDPSAIRGLDLTTNP